MIIKVNILMQYLKNSKLMQRIHNGPNIKILNKDEIQTWQWSYCSCGGGKHIPGRGSYRRKVHIGFICISI